MQRVVKRGYHGGGSSRSSRIIFDGDVFVYRGGRVPENLRERITRARIDKSVKIIDEEAFYLCINLLEVETHSGITKVKRLAFNRCLSLRGIKLPGVREIEAAAFQHCLSLTDAEFGKDLETIGSWAFNKCRSLRRIAIPLNIDFPLDSDNDFTQFIYCDKLATVDLVGGIHKTISSLHFESWRDEMNQEIGRINRVLPNVNFLGKATAIQQWIDRVIDRIAHYKTQHNALLKQATTLLELALWKAKLDDEYTGNDDGQEGARVTRGRVKRARKERCVTSGASIVIKNVLPFLQLAEL